MFISPEISDTNEMFLDCNIGNEDEMVICVLYQRAK